ncbi:hypothetical protein, partial [Chthonobacter albigriseus]|uniref:hypothetical protein n=1 Tax=Chthonobacter albigriseus TaxID=1683161 RepID=UPI0019D5B796
AWRCSGSLQAPTEFGLSTLARRGAFRFSGYRGVVVSMSGADSLGTAIAITRANGRDGKPESRAIRIEQAGSKMVNVSLTS